MNGLRIQAALGAVGLLVLACSGKGLVPPGGEGCATTAASCTANGGSGAATDPAPVASNGGTGAADVVQPEDLVGNADPIDGDGLGSLDASVAVSPDPASEGDDRCDVGVYDPSRPPVALNLSGSLGAHDPVIIAAEGQYYYFSTGNGIAAKTSPDLSRWAQAPQVFATTPAWFQQQVPAYQPQNIWAPDISYFGGQYHLYYSVSSFGSNRSCIGHATRASLASGAWEDHEAVFCSNPPGQNDNFNAIDPNVILDEAGTPWMAFGSFWSGIQMIELDLDGERAGTEVRPIASRGGGAIEGPFIVRRCGFYYLFVSFDACCRGADSTYNTRVGRSESLFGPYVDRDGRAMLQGGGTLVLTAGGAFVGPGHNAVLIDGTRAYNVYHAYLATNGASQLRISELFWDAEGWPISGGP
jgi:arabinan endo-1,5-alpha-L-arabinosidase